MGVRGVLCPCGAGGTRAAGGQVTADSLLGHIIGQAAAAGAGCWWGASAVERRADSMFYCHYYAGLLPWRCHHEECPTAGMPLAKAKR